MFYGLFINIQERFKHAGLFFFYVLTVGYKGNMKEYPRKPLKFQGYILCWKSPIISLVHHMKYFTILRKGN